MSETKSMAVPEQITQSFTMSTGQPKRKTEIIDKQTGAIYAVLKQPIKHAKVGDEIVRRYNTYATQAAQIEAMTLQRDALVDACRKALPELNRVSPSLSAPFIRAALAAVGDKHD